VLHRHGRFGLHQPNVRSVRYAIETILTLAFWAALLYLMVVYIFQVPAHEKDDWLIKLSDFFLNIGMIALIYLLILGVNLSLMSLWATVNKRRAMKRPQQVSATELEYRRMMRAFDVSRSMFERLTQSNVVTIFHDEDGKIEAIRIGCHIPLDGSLSELPPETFMPTTWDEPSEWGNSDESEGSKSRIANAWK